MLETTLASLPQKFRKLSVSPEAIAEAKKRVLDSIACFYGAFDSKPSRILRDTFGDAKGECALWGTSRRVPAETAAWINGSGVRALDYNDTYLSKEPCHPSDLIASYWAACELSGAKKQGHLLLEAMVLGYEVVCRLCDARSLRARGWDHVNYIGIASAIGCSYILKLSTEETSHAIALTVVANNAMRQTRVGTISDWKASCAAYAARAGLNAARLAQNGFTGPSHIFSGHHGFFKQVSADIPFSMKNFGKEWKILSTHTKFFPAEHHAQSAVEAALRLAPLTRAPYVKRVVIDSFDAAVDIIGSEKEKWRPTTRETADHSLPYMVCAALLAADLNLGQYESKYFLKPVVRSLMRKTVVRRDARYNRLYPLSLPSRVTVVFVDGTKRVAEVIKPKGYAGRPMLWEDTEQKFHRLARRHLSEDARKALIRRVRTLDTAARLRDTFR